MSAHTAHDPHELFCSKRGQCWIFSSFWVAKLLAGTLADKALEHICERNYHYLLPARPLPSCCSQPSWSQLSSFLPLWRALGREGVHWIWGRWTRRMKWQPRAKFYSLAERLHINCYLYGVHGTIPYALPSHLLPVFYTHKVSKCGQHRHVSAGKSWQCSDRNGFVIKFFSQPCSPYKISVSVACMTLLVMIIIMLQHVLCCW